MGQGWDWARASDRDAIREQLTDAASDVAESLLTASSESEKAHCRYQLQRIYTRQAVIDLASTRTGLALQRANRLRVADGRASLRAMASILEQLGLGNATAEFGLKLAKSWAQRAQAQQMFVENLQGPDEALAVVAKLVVEEPIPSLASQIERLARLVACAMALPKEAALGWSGELGANAFWDVFDEGKEGTGR